MKFSTQMIRSAAILLVVFLFGGTQLNAQCAGPAKAGIKKLAPFMHNGKLNTVTVILDEPSQVNLSVYKGLNYKFQIGSEDALGKLTFRVLDESKNEIYNSAGSKDPESWVFFSNSSQNFIVEIFPAEKGKQGCAYIVVGIAEPKKNNVRNL